MADNALFDFTALSNVAIKLIEAIEHACGWFVNHDNPKRIARNSLIEEIQKSSLDPLEKSACISNVNKIMREYNNQQNIVSEAIKKINASAKPENVDQDWLAQFMDKARLISDEEIQQIWSKLLADECNEPNSVPKSLLFILEKMDKDDAEAFVKLCRLSVSIDKNSFPIILGDEYGKGKYDKYGIDYELLLQLDKLGLIENSVDKINEFYTSEGDLFDNTSVKAVYHGEEYVFPEDFRTIPTGKVIYTKTGQALCKAINCDITEGFWAEIARPWFEYHSKHFLENPNEYDSAIEVLKMQMMKTDVE